MKMKKQKKLGLRKHTIARLNDLEMLMARMGGNIGTKVVNDLGTTTEVNGPTTVPPIPGDFENTQFCFQSCQNDDCLISINFC